MERLKKQTTILNNNKGVVNMLKEMYKSVSSSVRDYSNWRSSREWTLTVDDSHVIRFDAGVGLINIEINESRTRVVSISMDADHVNFDTINSVDNITSSIAYDLLRMISVVRKKLITIDVGKYTILLIKDGQPQQCLYKNTTEGRKEVKVTDIENRKDDVDMLKRFKLNKEEIKILNNTTNKTWEITDIEGEYVIKDDVNSVNYNYFFDNKKLENKIVEVIKMKIQKQIFDGKCKLFYFNNNGLVGTVTYTYEDNGIYVHDLYYKNLVSLTHVIKATTTKYFCKLINVTITSSCKESFAALINEFNNTAKYKYIELKKLIDTLFKHKNYSINPLMDVIKDVYKYKVELISLDKVSCFLNENIDNIVKKSNEYLQNELSNYGLTYKMLSNGSIIASGELKTNTLGAYRNLINRCKRLGGKLFIGNNIIDIDNYVPFLCKSMTKHYINKIMVHYKYNNDIADSLFESFGIKTTEKILSKYREKINAISLKARDIIYKINKISWIFTNKAGEMLVSYLFSEYYENNQFNVDAYKLLSNIQFIAMSCNSDDRKDLRKIVSKWIKHNQFNMFNELDEVAIAL